MHLNSASSYYSVLEVTNEATPDQIKKSYHRLARRYHPDKNVTQTSSTAENFQRIQQAYEVLSNPRKRQIYDSFGEEGLRTFDVFPGMEVFTRFLFLPVPLILFGYATCLLLLPIFLALRIDGSVEWNWFAVFIPVWYLLIFPLFILGALVFVSPDLASRIFTAVKFVVVLGYSSLPVLACLKLNDPKVFSWAIAFIGIFVAEGIFFIENFFWDIPTAFRASSYNNSVSTIRRFFTYVLYLLVSLVPQAVRIMFWAFFIAKLEGTTSMSGFSVISPLFVLFGFGCFSSCYNMKHLPAELSNERDRHTYMASYCFLSCINVFLLIILIFIGLRADNIITSTSVAFIPFFIIFGLMWCLCCCGCLCGNMAGGMPHDMENPSQSASPDASTRLLVPYPPRDDLQEFLRRLALMHSSRI